MLSSLLFASVVAEAQVQQRLEKWYDPTTWDWPSVDLCASSGGGFDISDWGNVQVGPNKIIARNIGLTNQPQQYQYIRWEVRNGYFINDNGVTLGTGYDGPIGYGAKAVPDDGCVPYMEVRGWAMRTGVGGGCGDKYDAVGVTFIQTPGYVNNATGISLSSPSVNCGSYAAASLPWLNDTYYQWYIKAPGSSTKIAINGTSTQQIDLTSYLTSLGVYEISAETSPTISHATPGAPAQSTCVIWPARTVSTTINVTNRITSFTVPTQTVVCDQSLNITAPYYNNVTYTWNIPNAVYNGTPSQNANIKYFGATGTFNASCTITPINGSCGVPVTNNFVVNVSAKTAGPLLDNNSGLPVGTVYPSANGLYNLRLQQLVNGATYIWELPDTYALIGTTPTINKKTTSETSGQITGIFPVNSLVDFTGKVTVTGPCGNQVFPFTIKARVTASVPSIVRTCAFNVIIPINNPNNDIVSSVWLASGGGATVSRSGNSAVVVRITDGGASQIYPVGIALSNVGTLNSTVFYNTGSGVWASGTLADERRDVGSNLALGSNRKIYFTTRDNKMWYYEFSNGLGKWDALPVLSVTNAKVVPNGYSDVVAIGSGIYYLDGSNRIYYVENGSNSPFGSVPLYATKLYTPTNSFNTGLFYRQPDGVIKYGTSSTNITNTDDERFLVDNNTIYYAKGGYLYKATIGNAASETQLVSGKTILSGTDLEFYGAYLYFIGSDKALYRFNVATRILDNALTPTGYCEGQFAINPQTGVVYVKTKDPNTSYHRVGQAYQQGNTWLVKNATTSVNDYMDGDIVFSNPNVFYVTTRTKPSTVGENINSIWNLYFYDECTPAVFRKGDTESEELANTAENIGFVAYPSPMANQLTVKASQQMSEGAKVVLFDAFGRKVAETEMSDVNANISTSELQSGLYVVKVYEAGTVVYTQKIVK